MSRNTSVVTANLLGSGEVVYLAAGGLWVVELGEAEVARDKTELARLEAQAQHAIAGQHVTAVYAMDVGVIDGQPTALSVREQIRAAHRPTV